MASDERDEGLLRDPAPSGGSQPTPTAEGDYIVTERDNDTAGAAGDDATTRTSFAASDAGDTTATTTHTTTGDAARSYESSGTETVSGGYSSTGDATRVTDATDAEVVDATPVTTSTTTSASERTDAEIVELEPSRVETTDTSARRTDIETTQPSTGYVATDATVTDTPPTRYATTDVAENASTMSAETTAPRDAGAATVQLHEEELEARTVQRQAGEVRVTKDVVEEERTLEVPVTRERVTVESREVSDPSAVEPAQAFQEGTVSMPVREEEVEVSKTTRVVEEIAIDKEAVQETERVTDTVRREVADVDRVGDVDVGTDRRDR